MAGKTPTSIDVLVDIQHGKFGIDHDDSFETWGEAARFLQGITDAIAAKAGTGHRREQDPLVITRVSEPEALAPFTATELVEAITSLTLVADDPNYRFTLQNIADSICGMRTARQATPDLAGGAVDPEGKTEVETSVADLAPAPAAVLALTSPEPICEKCGNPKTRKTNGHFCCKACLSASCSKARQGRKSQSRQETAAVFAQRQTIDPPIAANTATKTAAAPPPKNGPATRVAQPAATFATEPPATFPWSDRNFRAALSVLNSPAAERAKHIIMTRRVNSFKSVTPANMRVGDEAVASFCLTNGRWYGTAESDPASEYLIPEAWYGS